MWQINISEWELIELNSDQFISVDFRLSKKKKKKNQMQNITVFFFFLFRLTNQFTWIYMRFNVVHRWNR